MIEKTPMGQFWPMLSEPFRQFGHKLAEFLSPAVDASSDDDVYSITMELPGVAQKDIDISVDQGVMTIRGEKRASREEKGETWFFSERQYGAFSRSFRLPADADPDRVDARLKDGVLTLRLPRKPAESVKGKRIEITTD
jgi:HSP20 family protein